MTAITLSAATEQEKDFIFEAYKLAMRNYVEWAWGWDDAFQYVGLWASLPVTGFRLIKIAEQLAGAIYLEENDEQHYLRTLFLQPEFQGMGIGTALLEQEIIHARNADKKLVLKVIKINPAKRLYDRLGFQVIDEDSTTYHMQL